MIYRPYVYNEKMKQGKVSVNSEPKTSKKAKEKTNEDYASEIAKKYGLDTPNPTDIKARQKVKLPTVAKKETPEIVRPQLKATPEGMNYGGRIAQDTSMPYATSQNKSVEGTLNLTPGQRAVRDIPRNALSGALGLAKQGIQVVSQKDGSTEKLLTEQEFNAQSGLRKVGRTYEDYKRYTDQKNSSNTPLKNIGSLVEKTASEVNEDTTLGEQIIRSVFTNILPSMGSGAMGGAMSGTIGTMTANKAIIEIARNSPLFLNSVDEGLGDADKLGLKGTERATYAVGNGLIQTITERISTPGLEGARLGLTEITKKGIKESLFDLAKSQISEGGTEGLATLSTQIMQQFGYGVEQDWAKNIEEIFVSASSGAIMGGADVVGTMVSGVGYRTVGVDGDKVIVETTDGRVERVDPKILANFKINETKRAYLTKNQTEEIIPEVKATDTIPTQEPTINQDELQPNNEVSTPKELESVTEPLNGVVGEISKTEQITPEIEDNVPEVNELDKLKSWVANVEKNEIQKSSKQNKAKYDKVVEKIKALDPTFKVEPEIKTETVEPKKAKLPKLKSVKIGEYKGEATTVNLMHAKELVPAEGYKVSVDSEHPIFIHKNGDKWLVTDFNSGIALSADTYATRPEALRAYKERLMTKHLDYVTNPDNIKAIEKQMEKINKISETKEKLVSNKMEMTGTMIAPPIIPKVTYEDEMVGFSETKTSKVKSSLNNAEWVDSSSKEILNDNPMEYQTVTNNGDRRYARSKIESDFNATFEEMRTKVKEEKELSSKDWMTLKELQKTVQALQKENPEVSYEDDKNDIFNMMRTYSTSKGQGLQAMKDEMPRSERYYATETLEETVQDDIDKALNPSQKEDVKVAVQILDELFVEVERNKDGTFTMSDKNLDKLVEVVTENFKVHKKSRAVWERALKIDLKKERITKTQVLDKISEILKIPRLTTPEANAMMDALDNMQKAKKDSVDYWKSKTKLDDMIALSKADWIDKVNAWQVTAMLGNIPTAGRNQIGTFGAVGAIKPTSDIAAYFIDRIKNRHNNKVNIAPPVLNPVNYVKYWGQGQYKIWYDFVNNVNTGSAIKGEDTENSKYEVGSTRVFNNKVAHTYYRFTKALLSDYPHKLAIYNMEMDRISLGEAQAKAKKQKFNGTLQRQLVNDITEEYTFNNNTGLSKMATSIVADLNLLTGDRRIGLGTALARFVRTQMNIVNFTADHLGVDVLRQTIRGKQNSYKYGIENAAEMRQINMTKAQAKAISGVALLALGAWLSSHGIIIDEEEDEDKKKMLEAQGIKGTYLNVSALARYAMSILPGGEPIFDKTLGELRDGDQPISILFAQPLATHLLMGSRLSKVKDVEDMWQVPGKFVQVFGESISDFVEMPMSKVIGTLTDDNLNGTQKFAKITGNILTGFIPSPLKKATQAFDPYSKKISNDAGEGFVQTIKTATLPVLRKQVPNWFDVTGTSVPYYDTNNKLSALLQAETYPWYGSTVKLDPDMQRMLKQYDEGKLGELPTQMRNYFTVDGERVTLNATEHQKFQQYYFKEFVNLSKTSSEPHSQAYSEAKKMILKEVQKKK